MDIRKCIILFEKISLKEHAYFPFLSKFKPFVTLTREISCYYDKSTESLEDYDCTHLFYSIPHIPTLLHSVSTPRQTLSFKCETRCICNFRAGTSKFLLVVSPTDTHVFLSSVLRFSFRSLYSEFYFAHIFGELACIASIYTTLILFNAKIDCLRRKRITNGEHTDDSDELAGSCA